MAEHGDYKPRTKAQIREIAKNLDYDKIAEEWYEDKQTQNAYDLLCALKDMQCNNAICRLKQRYIWEVFGDSYEIREYAEGRSLPMEIELPLFKKFLPLEAEIKEESSDSDKKKTGEPIKKKIKEEISQQKLATANDEETKME